MLPFYIVGYNKGEETLIRRGTKHMETHIHNHALRLYRAAKRQGDPLSLLLDLLVAATEPYRAAPIVAALWLLDPDAEIPDTPFFRKVWNILRADSIQADPECANGKKLTADYQIIPASDWARKEMSEWREKNGLTKVGAKFVKPFKSDRHNDFTLFDSFNPTI